MSEKPFDLTCPVHTSQGDGRMSIHPIIDKPPSFPQTVLRLFTGSTHCCDWCEARWHKVHHTGQLEAQSRRCPYCGQCGCPPSRKTLEEMPRVESHDPTCMAVSRVGPALRKRTATNGKGIEE